MKALMVPIALGYGTAARVLSIANEMTRRGHEAFFAAGEDLESIIEKNGYHVRIVTDVKIDKQSRYSVQEQIFIQQSGGRFLEDLLEDLTRAIRDYQVDFLVYSNNNMASLAAAKADIPSVSIFHPSILEVRSFTMLHAAYKKWRKWGDMVKRANPPREVKSALFGDLNYVPSLPQFAKWPLLLSPDIYAHKDSAQPVGALTVRPLEELPSREELRKEFGVGEEPFVYATVGGAVFNPELLESLVKAFEPKGYRLFVTAGSQTPEEMAARLTRGKITVKQYVPEAIRLIRACDVLIWHGGHETMMEAVATGTPAVVVPQQYDQKTNAKLFAETGAGIMIPKREASSQRLAQAVDSILHCPIYKHKAESLRHQSESLGGTKRIVDEMEEVLGLHR